MDREGDDLSLLEGLCVDMQQHVRRRGSALGQCVLGEMCGRWERDRPRQVMADGSNVEVVDYLYAQAAVLEVLLCEKVWQWAAASGGKFYRKAGDGSPTGVAECCEGAARKRSGKGRELVAAQGKGAASDDVDWPAIKGLKRALEKMRRVYDDEACYLVDITRNAILFENAGDICACLKAIKSDKDVRIERIKNRMHPGFDSRATAGYRDVCINLRISSEWTRHVGVSMHVCEVQLLLVKISENKTAEGHSRYVQLRNSRGE
mmetsp:Transcript_17840/g.45051  ORF Transcript_17840/g.45051 Transcript_17840/m.45051 type:complete len:262 (+) Transcript_17840:504-1289(+)